MCSNSVFRLGFLEIKSTVIYTCFNTVRSDVTQLNSLTPKKISFDHVPTLYWNKLLIFLSDALIGMAMRGMRRPFVHICSDGLAPLQLKNVDDLIFFKENSA